MTDAHGKILGGTLFGAATARPRRLFLGDRGGVIDAVPGARHEEWIT